MALMRETNEKLKSIEQEENHRKKYSQHTTTDLKPSSRICNGIVF